MSSILRTYLLHPYFQLNFSQLLPSYLWIYQILVCLNFSSLILLGKAVSWSLTTPWKYGILAGDGLFIQPTHYDYYILPLQLQNTAHLLGASPRQPHPLAPALPASIFSSAPVWILGIVDVKKHRLADIVKSEFHIRVVGTSLMQKETWSDLPQAPQVMTFWLI